MPRVKGAPYRAQLDGLKFNRLFVIKRVAGSTWACRCDCDKEVFVTTYQLKSGRTKSCGCWSRDRITKHGLEGSPTYDAWAHMLQRCNNEKSKLYPHYGGRGITVCEQWKDFRNFFADMGDKPDGLSLDRIDNDGNYEPSNCQWADQKTQIRNRRVSPKYEFNGEIKSLAELAEMHNLPWRRVYERMRNGWTIEQALQPIQGKQYRRPKT